MVPLHGLQRWRATADSTTGGMRRAFACRVGANEAPPVSDSPEAIKTCASPTHREYRKAQVPLGADGPRTGIPAIRAYDQKTRKHRARSVRVERDAKILANRRRATIRADNQPCFRANLFAAMFEIDKRGIPRLGVGYANSSAYARTRRDGGIKKRLAVARMGDGQQTGNPR